MDSEQLQPGGAPPVVLAALTALESAVGALGVAVRESAWVLSDGESRDALARAARLRDALESPYLGLVRDLDSRPEAVAGARAGFVAATFLHHALRRSRAQAARDVRSARALDVDRAGDPADAPADDPVRMPCLAAALEAGTVSREHVDTAVRAMHALPKGLLRRADVDGIPVGVKADAYLAEQAAQLDPDTFRHLCTQLRAYLDPEHETFDAEAYARRFCTWRVDQDGMVVGRFALPAAAGAAVVAALEAFSAPQPASEQPDESGRPVLVPDDRTQQQRRADALEAICRHVNTCGRDGEEGGRRGDTRVVVVADLDQLAAARAAAADDARRAGADAGAEAGAGARAGFRLGVGRAHCLQTGPITPQTLQALACDTRLQAVLLDRSGAVLDLGRSVRTVTLAQRRAVTARDRGCVIPGCHAPPGRCQVHHVRWWRHGGRTDLGNLAMVCHRHHADIHAGVWGVEMVAGVPHGIPPAWVNPARPRLRNTVHRPDALAKHFSTQLTIDLTGDVTGHVSDLAGRDLGEPDGPVSGGSSAPDDRAPPDLSR